MRKLIRLILLVLLLLAVSNAWADEYITIKSSPQHSEFADNLLVELNKNIDLFQRRIGVYPDFPLEIVIAVDANEYIKFTNSKQKIIEFSSAVYNRRLNTIYVRSPEELNSFYRINKILLHEYIHAFVSHYFKKIPLWFNEGMSVYFSNDLGYNREINFIWNRLAGNTRTLNQMVTSYPKNRIEWESFYAKSGLAVKYLATNKKQQFYRFWSLAEQGKDFSTAFRMSFYQSISDYSFSFEVYSRSHFHYGLLLASSSLIWGVLPLVFLISVLKRKLKNRRITREWKKMEMEKLQSILDVEEKS